jgi:hypothetical protein
MELWLGVGPVAQDIGLYVIQTYVSGEWCSGYSGTIWAFYNIGFVI